MNEPTTIVVNALEYFDTNNEKYRHLFKNAKFIKFITATNDMDHNTIVIYDKNKDEILNSRYEIIGLYNNDSNIWAWAWSIPVFKKNSTYTSKKIINYGMNLDPEVSFLKTELITSRFKIANHIQLDIHVSLASYISKNPVVYRYVLQKKAKDILTVSKDTLIDVVEEIVSDEPSIVYYLFLLDYEKYI